MLLGVPRLKKILSGFFVSILLGVGVVSCGGYKAPSGGGGRSGVKFRAFVSNPLHPGQAGGGFPAIEIIDAAKDILSVTPISLSGAEPDAGLMAVSPKRDRTLVFSPSNNGLAVINNSKEGAAATTTSPGPTESMLFWTDGVTAFVAVPSAAVAGRSPGVVGSINSTDATLNALIPVPGAHYLVPSPNGSQILVISDSNDSVAVLAPALISNGNPLTLVSGTFDKPVGAVFSSDGSTAYVMNCGQQCGGISTASVAVVDMTSSPPTASPTTIPVPGATIGLVQGSSLYVAGTSIGQTCDPTAALCGQLSVIDLTPSSTPVSCVASINPVNHCQVFSIIDGYHNRMQMGANGQLFIGARSCTNITTPGQVRGCLSIFDTGSAKVVTPPDNGDVTSIEPIPNRHVVYVCEGGALRIYDTTTDKLQATQISIIGQAIDVKVVDF